MKVTPGSSVGVFGAAEGGTAAVGGETGGAESAINGGFEPRELEITGKPLVPRRILSLNPSSSTANSVSSERFMSSMICLICFRSKTWPWLS